MDAYYRPTRAEISLDALRYNIEAFRQALPSHTKMMAVVKANAYGHGALRIAREALDCGVQYLGVALLDEAIELRNAGITAPILVLGYTAPEGFELALQHDITLTIFREDMISRLAQLPKQNRRLKVHVKIDTGMGRLGLVGKEEAIPFIDKLLALSTVDVEGIFTHFAKADEADKHFTRQQYLRLKTVIDHYATKGIRFPIVHAGNSATAIDTPEYAFDMVRLGISMYGLYPSTEVNQKRIVLKPVMRLVTQIVMVKQVTEGTPVSYGGIYTAEQEGEWIATLPIGYADGYTRMLTGKAHVLVDGKRAPVVGRICMDQCMIRVSKQQAMLDKEVVLFGNQGEACLHVDELAQILGTINYEMTSMLAARVPKVYIRDGNTVDVQNMLFHGKFNRKNFENQQGF